MSRSQIVSIVGPTGSGKTRFALKLAQAVIQNRVFAGVNILSADSRQVYSQLSIVTGADVPEQFASTNQQALQHHYLSDNNATKLHGVSIISITEPWSVGHFKKLALQVLVDSKQREYLTIIVGGTGLYHVSAVVDDEPLFIAPNLELRQELSTATVKQLQVLLAQKAPAVFAHLNNSDRNNPRRLVRKIELAAAGFDQPTSLSDVVKHTTGHSYYGIATKLHELENNIQQRVIQRINNGALEEVELLLNTPAASSQARTVLGVAECSQYLAGAMSRPELITAWTTSERQYAKRQLTWWQKYPVDWLNCQASSATKQSLEQVLANLE